MRTIPNLFLALALCSLSLNAKLFAAESVSVYGLHLFFSEAEAVDVLTLTETKDGLLSGQMFVPNDFEGPLLNLAGDDLKLSFELLVPKNIGRPNDLIFVYEGQFFDATKRQLTGFVRLKNQSGFIASFVAFKRTI